MKVRATLIGCGRWGSKLLGALIRNPRIDLVGVADRSAEARARAAEVVAGLPVVESLSAALRLGPEAVLVATPSVHHAEHAHAVIEAGVDVFVEKPLALTLSEASGLCDAVARGARIGMVGHVLRYHPAVVALADLVRRGAIGAVRRVEGRRWTQSGSAAPLWTLGPHDLSTLHALDPSAATRVEARFQQLRGDAAKRPVAIEVGLESGVEACFELSTAASAPARRLTVIGSDGRLEIDELRSDRPLSLAEGRNGDPVHVEVAPQEPLQAELDHLAQCVRDRREPRTSFEEGRWVVEQLERAQRMLDSGPSDAASSVRSVVSP
ncbi:MAG: Gfo/Idh/MocA family oxidoreductase [Deltaproteobacteria bacterium]|nr:Gfo/Idh/MocA family oxidoreductase [Deltaproteobacteria bacterium]MBW2536472.1 Gfo/Idh/MocA family oxidoreductase [Deltaproteobacteria bacterium]